MKNLGTWASGYHPDMLAEASPRDIAVLRKLATTVWFSSGWAFISWAVASISFTEHAPFEMRLVLAVAAGVFGSLLIMVFDRSTLFFLDTTRLSLRATIAWAVFRITLIVAIGSAVDAATMPVLMKAELTQAAFQNREASDAERQTALAKRFNVAARESRFDISVQQASKAEEALRTIPAPIAADITRGRECAAEIAAVRGNLRRQGYASPRIAELVSGRVSRCRELQRRASAELSAYKQDAEQHLTEARATAADARAAYGQASGEISSRLKGAREIEAATVTENSYSVFWDLVLSNFGAALKASALLIFQLSIELLPFLMKGLVGRTAIGEEIAARHERDCHETEGDTEIARNETHVRVSGSQAAASAMLGALARPTVRQKMEDLAEHDAIVMASLDQAITTLQRVAERERQYDKIKVKTPRLQAMKFDIWTRAIAAGLAQA
jgi:hypothetical protein